MTSLPVTSLPDALTEQGDEASMISKTGDFTSLVKSMHFNLQVLFPLKNTTAAAQSTSLPTSVLADTLQHPDSSIIVPRHLSTPTTTNECSNSHFLPRHDTSTLQPDAFAISFHIELSQPTHTPVPSHPMVTRLKLGALKHKAFSSTCLTSAVSSDDIKPRNTAEALTKPQWHNAMIE
ncbi:hypothetical protein LWI29_006079 [Acer saccharum]|uniref:Uncharacterized protein n=1 Tax=Acer saccharum TaxID=4024 RepID=A0AA39T9Z2_ACESA|nr:hypothetical protein LWI29_006079 [Acer saccharum]